MSGVVRHIKYVNRLAKLIRTPGGKRMSDAIADAQTALGEIEPACVENVDALIAQIAQLAAEQGPHGGAQIYALSNEIIGLAGVFGLRELSAASYSLCELIDRTGEGKSCTSQALAVHVESLKLLRHPERLGAAGGTAVLDGLARVVSHASIPA